MSTTRSWQLTSMNLNSSSYNYSTTTEASLIENNELMETPLGFRVVNDLICGIFSLCYLLVIVFILLDKKILQNTFNVILLSLAVLDMSILFVTLILEVQSLKSSVAYEPYVWIYAFYIQFVFYNELWHNIMIALNRTLLILRPTIYAKIEKVKYMLIQVLFVWIVAVLWSWPVTTNLGSTATKIGTYVQEWDITKEYESAELIFAPSSIIFSMLLYVFLFFYVRKTRRKVAAHLNGNTNQPARNGPSEYVILFQSFYISFTLGCLLFSSYIWIMFQNADVEYYLLKVFSWFVYTGNPLMYTTFGSQFREIAKEKINKFKNRFCSHQ